MANRYPMTQHQFDQLGDFEDWKIVDIPRKKWESIPNMPRRDDTIALMGSGDFRAGTMNGINNIIAGIDVLVDETKPIPGEKPGNAYHMIIQELNDTRYPYLMHGPFTKDTVVPHHFEADDLDCYFLKDSTEDS